MRNTLLDGDLKTVVVGVLVGANDEYVAIGRIRRRESELCVQRAAIVDGCAGIRITAGLCFIGAGRAIGALRCDVEDGTIDVVVDRILTVESTDVVDADR